MLLAEAHRLGASDLAIACGTHPADGDWWVASPSDVLVEGAVARAAGLDPRELPGIRAIARHELLASWEAEQTAPDLRGVATGAVAAAVLAARERSAGRRPPHPRGRRARHAATCARCRRRCAAGSRARRKVGMTPLRFGVVGCGAIVTLHQLPALRRCPSLELVGLVDRDRDWAAKVAKRFRRAGSLRRPPRS